jgi:hypothetical protein
MSPVKFGFAVTFFRSILYRVRSDHWSDRSTLIWPAVVSGPDSSYLVRTPYFFAFQASLYGKVESVDVVCSGACAGFTGAWTRRDHGGAVMLAKSLTFNAGVRICRNRHQAAR